MTTQHPAYKHALILLARALLASIFVTAGIDKIIEYSSYIQAILDQHLPYPSAMLIASTAFELVGGLLVLLGYKARLGAGLLLIFMVPATLIFHDFWTFQPADTINGIHHFMKNMAIFGGLLYVLAIGSGKYSLDHKKP